jgi:hypothetical protein
MWRTRGSVNLKLWIPTQRDRVLLINSSCPVPVHVRDELEIVRYLKGSCHICELESGQVRRSDISMGVITIKNGRNHAKWEDTGEPSR